MGMIKQATPVIKVYQIAAAPLTTVSVLLSKNGGVFGAPSDGGITSLTNGWYSVSLDATDTDTLGDLAIQFAAVVGTPVNPPAEQVVVPAPEVNAVKINGSDASNFVGTGGDTLKADVRYWDAADAADFVSAGIFAADVISFNGNAAVNFIGTGSDTLKADVSYWDTDAAADFVTTPGFFDSLANVVQFNGNDAVNFIGAGSHSLRADVSYWDSVDATDFTSADNHTLRADVQYFDTQDAGPLLNGSANALVADVQQWLSATPNGLTSGCVHSTVERWKGTVPADLNNTYVRVCLDEWLGTVPANLTGGAGGLVQVNVQQWSAGTAPAIPGDQMDLVNAPNATALTAIATAIWSLANAIETGITPAMAMRLLAASQGGKLTKASGTVTIRDCDDSKDVVIATTDADGQRLTVTLDLT